MKESEEIISELTSISSEITMLSGELEEFKTTVSRKMDLIIAELQRFNNQ